MDTPSSNPSLELEEEPIWISVSFLKLKNSVSSITEYSIVITIFAARYYEGPDTIDELN